MFTKERINEFIVLVKKQLTTLEQTKGKDNKVTESLKMFKLFESPIGDYFLITYPSFRSTFINKLDEFYKDVPDAFEPFVLKYNPNSVLVETKPISSRTRSKSRRFI